MGRLSKYFGVGSRAKFSSHVRGQIFKVSQHKLSELLYFNDSGLFPYAKVHGIGTWYPGTYVYPVSGTRRPGKDRKKIEILCVRVHESRAATPVSGDQKA